MTEHLLYPNICWDQEMKRIHCSCFQNNSHEARIKYIGNFFNKGECILVALILFEKR